jgi:hypothetical protein
MNTEENKPPPICEGANCDFFIDTMAESVGCLSGGGTCATGDLLEAEESKFHDEILIEATHKIRQILSGIPADANNRKLSFLVTNKGLLLAWVNHDVADVPANGVTAKDDSATLAKSLKLKN